MSDKQLVQTYGLHQQDEFIWLHEQHRIVCLNPGFEGLPSPFEVRVTPRLRCPHSLIMPVAGITPTDGWTRVCAPVPQDGLYWCHPSRLWLLAEAARWMIPRTFDPVVHAYWSDGVTARSLASKVMLTNVAPLIVSDYHAADFRDVMSLAGLARTRAMVVSGYPRLPSAEDITPPADAVARSPEEWEAAAAAYLYQYVDKETRL